MINIILQLIRHKEKESVKNKTQYHRRPGVNTATKPTLYALVSYPNNIDNIEELNALSKKQEVRLDSLQRKPLKYGRPTWIMTFLYDKNTYTTDLKHEYYTASQTYY